MAKAFHTWTVLPHGPIEKLTENLWTVGGTMPDGRTRRVMTLARKSSGDVVIHNAIALDENEMKAVEAFGNLESMIVPNSFHRQDASIFKQRYGSLRVISPRGAMKKVAAVVPVDAHYDDIARDEHVSIEHLRGLKDGEGVMRVKSSTGTSLVFNDAVMNMPRMPFPAGFFLHPTGKPAFPRVMGWFLLRDREAFAAHLEELAAIPDLERVIVSHGRAITERPGDVLRSIASQVRG